MSKKYQELLAEQRRYRILRLINDDPGYRVNEVLIKSALNDIGIPTGSDRLRTDLAWMEEQDLVECEPIADLIIVRLKARGKDVAEGTSLVPGVKRPEPGR